MKVVAKSQELGKMLEKIRDNHIDIIPIIEEELSQVIPQIIEDVIRNIYNIKVEGV